MINGVVKMGKHGLVIRPALEINNVILDISIRGRLCGGL